MKYDHDEQIIKDELSTIQTPEFDIVGEVKKKLKEGRSFSNKKKYRRLAIAVCVCLMISTGVLAVTVGGFDKLLSKLSPEIVPMLQPIEMTSEDKGIKMEVVAAYNDDEMVVIYLTMQDLVSNRINESIGLYNYSLSKGSLFNAQTIDFHEETKTATIRIQANGGDEIDGEVLDLSIKSFLSDKVVFDQVETGIDMEQVQKEKTETIPLNMEHVSGGSNTMFDEWKEEGIIQVLKADERIVQLPEIEFMYISNIGFIDDKLHILTHWVGEGKDDHGYFYFTDREGNELKIRPSTVRFGIDEFGNTKDRGDYIEYAFDLGDIDLKEISLKGYFVSSGLYTEGDWKTKFQLKSISPEKEVEYKMDFGSWSLDSISVSNIGVTLLGSGIYDENQAPEVVVHMIDGSSHKISLISAFSSEGKIYLKGLADLPLDGRRVESISVNENVYTP